MLQVVDGTEEMRDLFLAQHNGKLLPPTHGGDVLLDNPGSPEGHGVEEPERGDRDDDRTGRETALPRQVKQIRPDLGWPEKVRRFTKVTGEPEDIRGAEPDRRL